MDINLDVSNYLKSIVPEWNSSKPATGKFIKRIVRNINKNWPKPIFLGSSNIKTFDSILKLETMIRVCQYIEEITRSRFKTNNSVKKALESLKTNEFTWYKNVVKQFGEKKKATQTGHQEQIFELLKIVKKYSKSITKDSNERDENGRTPILRACLEGNIDRMRILKALGADVRLVDNDGSTALHLVMKCRKNLDSQNEEDIIQFLLKEGVDINAKNNNGRTPLLVALDNKHTERAKLLINNGADIKISSANKKTPLHIACYKGNQEIVKLILLKDRETIDFQDVEGYTPLFTALCHGHTECAEILIKNGANSTICNKYKESPLHVACIKGNKDIVEKLIKKSPESIDAQDEKDCTPLAVAIFYNQVECAKLLIEKNANASIVNCEKETTLHFACQNGNRDILELILMKNPELINVQSSTGSTPLFTAVFESHVECAQLLIENNADVTIANNDKETPLHCACKNGLIDLAEEMLSVGADPNGADKFGVTPLYQMVIAQDEEFIKLLISNGAEITDNPTYDGDSIFSLLLRYSDILSYKDLAKNFLKDKKKVDLHRGDSFGNTPLHYVCRYGLSDLLKLFNGVKLIHFFENNIYYETPLQIALNNAFWSDPSKNMNVFLKLLLIGCLKNEKQFIEAIKNGRINGFLECFQQNIKEFLRSAQSKKINPIMIVLLINSHKIAFAIEKELGQKKFQEYLYQLPKEDYQALQEFMEYEIDDAHLSVDVLGVLKKPDEKEYQFSALLDIFKELTGYDPKTEKSSESLEQKFRSFLPTKEMDSNSDKDVPLKELYERLTSFIDNCTGTKTIVGIKKGSEKVFWNVVKIAVTNTIKSLLLFQGSQDETYEKKTQMMREYLSIFGYCATRLDIELEKLYHLNSGVVRSFKDQIYFQLSERRRQVLENLAPRDPQNIHYIQGMLSKLSKYNIPIRTSPDLFPNVDEALDIEESFKSRYQYGLLADIKDYIKSNEDIREMFFQWLKENERTLEKLPLSQKDISNGLKYIKDHHGEFTEPLAKDLIKYLKLMYGDDYREEIQGIKKEEILSIIKCLTDPIFLTQDDFEKIIQDGDESFANLDIRLKSAIKSSQFKGKLSENFKTKIPGRLHLSPEQQEKKKVILDKYLEIHFPSMVKEVTDKDVEFLLEKFGVLKSNSVRNSTC